MKQKQMYVVPEISCIKMNLSENINETLPGGGSGWTDEPEAKQSDFLEYEDDSFDDSQSEWASN
jgi:hypothetical protein